MVRGFLSGIAMGAVVATVGAVGLSLMIGTPDLPDLPKPEAVASEGPAWAEPGRPDQDAQADLPTGEPGPRAPGKERLEESMPDDPASVDAGGIRPAELPQTDQPGSGSSPPPGGDAPAVSVARDALPPIVLPGELPTVPLQEASVTTDPSLSRPPEAETGAIALALPDLPEPQSPSVLSEAPAKPTLSDRATEGATTLSQAERTSERPNAMTAPREKATPATEELAIRVDPAPARPNASTTVLEPNTDEPRTAPLAEPEAEKRGDDDGAGTMPGANGTDEEEQDRVERPDASQSGGGDADPVITIGRPATRLTERNGSGTTSNRPMIGTAAQSPALRETPVPETAEPTSKPPIQRFSAPFDDIEDKPRMAIVLIDDPDSGIDIEALSDFPYALSFAVDASRPDARDRMALYRDAGFEVLALVDLPEGARAEDVEVAMPVLLERVPEAVGVMEAPGDGIQSSREIVTQVTEIAETTGHGLLLYPKGLDTGRKLAVRAGVPAASIFRDFDAKGEEPRVIRRFLNYAALKAEGEENGVVMVGRLRADTVSALVLWGLEDRARDIALTPVSAIMQAAQP
ncbi:divergent polysaccharide deacetylase family protein [Aquicoccus sp.]|uniref:divergent polysaccharide deacetylase family protein n=1 Tax=Aquicoccus sp. TaxID=2055851 RepID=UPI003568F066